MPTYLGAQFRESYDENNARDVRDSLGLYLLTGLRASCRTFAKLVPKPRRNYIYYVCREAADALNVDLCAALGRMDILPPGFAAIRIYEEIKYRCSEEYNELITCVFDQIDAAGLWESMEYCSFIGNTHKCAGFIRGLFERGKLRGEMMASIGSIVQCPDPHITDIVRSLLTDRTLPSYIRWYDLIIEALGNTGSGAVELFDYLTKDYRISEITSPYILDPMMSHVVVNKGPCMLALYERVRRYARPDVDYVFEGVAENMGPDAMRLLDLTLPSVISALKRRGYIHAAYNRGPCAMDMYKKIGVVWSRKTR